MGGGGTRREKEHIGWLWYSTVEGRRKAGIVRIASCILYIKLIERTHESECKVVH